MQPVCNVKKNNENKWNKWNNWNKIMTNFLVPLYSLFDSKNTLWWPKWIYKKLNIIEQWFISSPPGSKHSYQIRTCRNWTWDQMITNCYITTAPTCPHESWSSSQCTEVECIGFLQSFYFGTYFSLLKSIGAHKTHSWPPGQILKDDKGLSHRE